MSTAERKLTREEIAKIEIGHTNISCGMVWTFTIVFLAVIFLIPSVQILREKGVSGTFGILYAPGRAAKVFAESEGSLFRRLLAGNNSLLRDIHIYEDNLEKESFLTKMLIPPVQLFIASYLGAGNEKAYIGHDNWLFFRPSLDYLTGPGFLDPTHLARRAASGNEWTAAPQPDPRKAILEFRDQLKERDITLILVSAPTKPGVHPGRLSGRYRDYNERPLHNVSYESFTRELRNENVLICELDEVLKQEGTPGYLSTDTHWRPETVAAVAQHLADFVKESVTLPELSESGYKQMPKPVTNHGDIKHMMKLPENQTTFEPETVNIQQVVNSANEFWRPSASADVLLLGDSFSNIYSLASMRWGNSAGLAEQLSFYLQRPLDVIIRNDEGAHATRGALSRDLARGKDRLAGKRVVIWEFAERELALGNWKHLPMELNPDPEPSRFVVPAEGTEMIVTGVVEAVSGIPKPGSVVYPDHIFSVHLSQLRNHQGQDIPGGEAVVYLYSMQAHTPTTASQLLRPGREAKLRLQNWTDVEVTHGSIRRSELDNQDLLFEDPCWGELLTQGAD